MNLSLLNSHLWEFLENPILTSNDFTAFTKLIMSKKVLELVKLYLQFILRILLNNYDKFEKSNKKNKDALLLELNNSKVRKFMSLFLFLYFPKIHKLDNEIKICKDLLNISRQLKFLLRGIVIFIKKTLSNSENNNMEVKIEEADTFRSGFLPVSYSFCSKLEVYFEVFDNWKKYDLENLIFQMSYDYYKFEKKLLDLENIDIYPELEMQCEKERKQILELVDKLDNTYGTLKFREYLDVIQDYDGLDDALAHKLFLQKISNLIHTNTMIEDWDMLEKELEGKHFDLLCKMLVEIKEAMKDCQPKHIDFHLELEEVIDEKFIVAQIKDGVFDISNFQKLIYFVLDYLRKFQSRNEDENTELFQQEMNQLLENADKNLPFAIRFFLENVYLKFDSIRRQLFILKHQDLEINN